MLLFGLEVLLQGNRRAGRFRQIPVYFGSRIDARYGVSGVGRGARCAGMGDFRY